MSNFLSTVNAPALKRDVIYTTTDYEGLMRHRLSSNRSVTTQHVKKVERGIEDVGQIAPVILTHKGVIIDGQNRVAACKAQEVEVRFTVQYVEDAELAQRSLNSVSKNWRDDDYLNSGVENDIPGFSKVRELMDTYGVTARDLQEIGLVSGITKKLRDGTEIVLCPEETKKRLGVFRSVSSECITVFGKLKQKTMLCQSIAHMMAILGDHPEDVVDGFSWGKIIKEMHNKKYDTVSKKERDLASKGSWLEFLEDSLKNNKGPKTTLFTGR